MKKDLKKISIKPVKSFAVFSDIHLRDNQDSNYQILLKKLKELQDIDSVFFIGDIFDFIYSGNSFFYDHWKTFFDVCRDLKKNRNIHVYFIEGNHDFGFEHMPLGSVKDSFTLCGDFQILIDHPKLGQVCLRHGDDIVSNQVYRYFRRFVKSSSIQYILRCLLSGKFAFKFFNWYAKRSRSQDKYRKIEDTQVISLVDDFLTTATSLPDVKLLIIGHVHIDIDVKTKTRMRLIIGPDWLSQPSYLFCDKNGDIRRVYL